MRRTALIASAIITVAALAGCASTGSTSGTTAAGAPSAAPSSAPVAAASPSPQVCTTHACIVQDLDKGLVGAIDQADAVATKIKCKASTVKNEGHGNYDARCTVRYSDHTYATGYGTVDMSQSKVLFTPDD